MLPSTFAAPPAPASAASSRRVPLDKRKRTETSCDKCKSRKQKCRKEPGQDTCRYCLQHKISCTTTQPRKKRLYGSVEGIGDRLALLESLVKHLLPDADVSNVEALRQLAASLSIPVPDTTTAAAASQLLHEDESGPEDRDEEDAVILLPDQQGQVQYIGPGSSFSFHMKLRSLVGSRALREFVLFGSNAADREAVAADGTPNALAGSYTTANTDGQPTTHRRPTHSPTDPSNLEMLVCAFFDNINRDFPVLHEVSFREAYENWLAEPASADPAWLCSFLCVLLLARRVARVDFTEDQERMWWRRVQTLLPVVIFTSSVASLQAMLLAALHLHNTNHRDASWSLTGSAVKIAFAMGLHQDKVSTHLTPLAKGIRKMLWWTLYSFEQMQVSSYDRPSAIEHPGLKMNRPNCKVVGMANYYPSEYCVWHNRLMILLGSACRAPRTLKPGGNEDSYAGPLSPASGVLRELQRWTDQLPQQLRLEAVDTSPALFARPLLLMHATYHYTVYVLCRSALLLRASSLSRDHQDCANPALVAMAETCVDSGRELARILLRMDVLGKFDAITWWDTWFALASGSMLVLDCVCIKKTTGVDMCESRILLSQLADQMQRHLRNPYVPGTLAKFASLVPELRCMIDAIDSTSPPMTNAKAPAVDMAPNIHHAPQPSVMDMGSYTYMHSTTNNGAYMLADDITGRMHPHPPFQDVSAYPNRNMQSQFMDFTINNIHDWNWSDLGNLLGNEAVPNTQTHPHAPLESPTAGSR